MRDGSLVFIFDFDGVIVDALPALYQAYCAFLESHGFSGNLDEFERLSSSMLAEIVSVLKRKYELDDRHESLLRHYHKQMSEAYRCAKLNDHIREILAYLSDRQCHLALASSSKRYIVQGILKYYKLDNFFEHILTGDDVTEGKPSPELYNKLKAHYEGGVIYAIEDTENGILSAQGAGLKTIHFDVHQHPVNLFTNYKIDSLMQIKKIVEEHRLNCFTIGIAANITLNIGNYSPKIPAETMHMINDLWEKDRGVLDLENGTVICYRSHQLTNGKLSIEGFVTEYKFIYAQQQSAQLNLNLHPIRVSGVVTDNQRNALVGVKDWSSNYAGYRKLIPTGKTRTENIQSGGFNIKQQTLEALEEEVGLTAKNVRRIDPLCLLYDQNDRVYKIASLIYVNVPIAQIVDELKDSAVKHEFKSLGVVGLTDSINEVTPYVPASKVLLNAIRGL